MAPLDTDLDSWARAAADRLREARESSGLSQRELARRAEVSWVTVREAERGRNVRRSSLESLLERLPGLSPRALLFGDERSTRTCEPRLVWEYYRRITGLELGERLEEFVLHEDSGLRRSTELRGLRWRDGSDGPEALQSLLRSVCPLDVEATRRLVDSATDEGEGPRWVTCGSAQHALVRESGRERPAHRLLVRRSCPPLRPQDRVLRVVLHHAGERVRVRLGAAGELAWPPPHWSVRVRRAHAEIDDVSEPDLRHCGQVPPVRAFVDESSRCLEAVMERPLPGLRLELHWGPEGATSAAAATRSDTEEPPLASWARALRLARERHALSQRQLAQRTGLSPRTIAAAENGSDPTARTLRSLVARLPGLQASDVLRAPSAPGPVGIREVWSYHAELFGFEAAEFVKTLQVESDGWFEALMENRGVRLLAGGARNVCLRQGFRSLGSDLPIRVEGLSVSRDCEDDAKTRIERNGPASIQHALLLPEALSKEGLTLRARFRARLAQTASDVVGGTPTPIVEPDLVGYMMRPVFGVRHARVRLRFRSGRLPSDVRFRCWHVGELPEARLGMSDLPDLMEVVHEGRWSLRLDPERASIEAEVKMPLVGLFYVVSWLREPESGSLSTRPERSEEREATAG